MLNKLRNFSTSKLAMVFVFIIAIPFVFWGMGGVFSSGNTNSIAKINNSNISTTDFMEYINNRRLNPKFIEENINNNILEELLSELVSKRLIELELKDFQISLSEKTLAEKIKNNEIFMNNKKEFSRIKYEKFLLENNLSAPIFETRLKQQELKKNLFNYISGGVQSPYFLKNKHFINEQKKVELEYIDLDLIYSKDATKSEVNEFIKENEELLKEDYIDFSYAKITPKDLVEIDKFNDEFFKKIDEIENGILNGFNINQIKNNYNFKINSYKKYNNEKKSDDILNFIYSKRNGDKIQLIDRNEYFLLIEITKIEKILPNISNEKFLNMVKNNLLLEKKFNFNKEIYEKIENKKFNNEEFANIAKNKKNIQNIIIENINDEKIFDNDSRKLIYSLPKSSFTLITGNKSKIFLAKIKNIYFKNLDKNDPKIQEYLTKSNNEIISNIYSSYDFSLNSKYKVRFFKETMDRVKNYFR